MAITNNDIKVFQAQDNTDNDSGGGARTSIEVKDGDVNNLFPDISRIDTVGGDVALRKIFPTVVTANNDVYYGAHAMIRKKPDDPQVSALMYHSDDPYDKRLSAQNGIESYVVASYAEEFYLFGNHVSGSKSVTFLQNLDQSVPVVGEVYLLVDDDGTEQYIRLTDVNVSNVVLTYQQGATFSSYERRRIIGTIDQALTYDFTGSTFNPAGKNANTTEVFSTQVADAAKFYSTRPLSTPAVTGANIVNVDSIYESLVPATKSQSPIINADPVSVGKVLKSSLSGYYTVAISLTGADVGNLGVGVTPSSLTIGTAYNDDGVGNIVRTSDGVTIGSIDYYTGDVVLGSLFTSSGNFDFTFIPAAKVDTAIAYTGSIKITQGNQSYTYVKNLSPMPSHSALVINYRSQGKWYRILGNSDNSLGDDVKIGKGLLLDNGDGTGTISLTLGSLPDIDSSILYGWGSSEVITDRSLSSNLKMVLEINLAAINIETSSLVLITQGATITSDAAGVLTDSYGAITGVFDGSKGIIKITNASSSRFSPVPTVDDIDVSYNYASPANIGTGVGYKQTADFAETNPTGSQLAFGSFSRATGLYSMSVGQTMQIEGVELLINTIYPTTRRIVTGASGGLFSGSTNHGNLLTGFNNRRILLISNAAGELKPDFDPFTSTNFGTVAANGVISLNLSKQYSVVEPNGLVNNGLGGSSPTYTTTLLKEELIPDSVITVKFRRGGALTHPSSQVNRLLSKDVVCSYTIGLDSGYIAGEVYFRMFSDTNDWYNTFFSRDGLVYRKPDLGTEEQVGTIDYQSGKISIDYIDYPHFFYFKPLSFFTAEYGNAELGQSVFDFRTASTKLLASSFQLRYNTENANNLTATTDANGVITGTDIAAGSFVEPDTGMVHIQFNNVFASLDSFKYDAVAETTLPLNPELLGLNPVRLPADGRVPIYDAGRHVIIFNEVTTPTTNPTPLANDVETLTRSGQAYIEVIDSNGNRLDTTQYTVDKALGTVTFSATLVLQDKYAVALVAPFSIVDRIEDMLQSIDVQVNGQLTLSGVLSHDYPADTSFVASTLVWGDTQSRVFNLFTQEIWDNGNPVWSDSIIGSSTTPQYDLINYPLTITNADSTSGRWVIIFKSNTTVDVAHEKLGLVQTNISIINDNIAPINPATGLPYFTMLKGGFGGGWIANNAIRFNTDSGGNNVWVIRTVQAGALTQQKDNIEIEIRGDAN